MPYIGERRPLYQYVLFIEFATINSVLFLIQILYLLQLKLLPLYLLPLLSFCMVYDNVISSYGAQINPNSNEAYAGYVFKSLQIPLFLVILHEMAYNLHLARSAHFLIIPFDEGYEKTKYISVIELWSIRLLAIALFILNMFSYFDSVDQKTLNGNDYGGYIYLSLHRNSRILWLRFIPIIVLSAFSILIGIVLYRYGRNLTFAATGDRLWILPIVGALGFTVCNIPDKHDYPWTSNLGELVLLISTTVLVKEIQNDLIVASSYADFLHKSNLAFHSVDPSNERKKSVDISNIYNKESEVEIISRDDITIRKAYVNSDSIIENSSEVNLRNETAIISSNVV